MPPKKLLCIVCGQEATHRTADGAPLCAAHAGAYEGAVPITDADTEEPAVATERSGPWPAPQPAAATAPPASAPDPTPAPGTGIESLELRAEDMARRISRELLAVILSVGIAIVGGSIGGGLFYAVVGYARGEEEALGGGYQSAAGVAAVVVAVIVFLVARKALSARFRRKI